MKSSSPLIPHPSGQPNSLTQITVFGGSGATGRALIRTALERGIQVKTLVRNPARLGPELCQLAASTMSLQMSQEINRPAGHDKNNTLTEVTTTALEVITGSLTCSSDVGLALEGSETVFCLFGPRPPYTDIFCEAATRTIIAAMKQHHIGRLICQTGGMIGSYRQNRTVFFQMLVALFNHRLWAMACDRAGQEQAVIGSGLTWTLVKPPRLVNAAATGHILVGPEVKLGLLSRLSREDLCTFLLDTALTGRHRHSAVFIRNP